MFCPNCGFNNDEGVNYCKRCGWNLNPAPPVRNVSSFVVLGFLAVILFLTIAGFGLPMAAMSELSNKIDQRHLLFFSALILLAVFGIDAMLIQLLTRLLGISKSASQGFSRQDRRAKDVTSGQQYEQLPQPPIAMTSVTEHTTRNFDPIDATEHRARNAE